MQSPAPKIPTRLADLVALTNGLNAARALAALLVVLFHAAAPYVTSRVTTWILFDDARHFSVDVLIFGVNGFVMPLFFLLAGWSAAKSCGAMPTREFAWNRLQRLGTPFLLSVFLIAPLSVALLALGLLWSERIPLGDLPRLHIPSDLRPMLVGPGHLWFLEYLLIISVAWSCLVRGAVRWKPAAEWVRGEWAHGALASAARPLWFAVPSAALFLCDPGTPYRLLSPIVPDISRLAHYGVFFVAGVWLSTLPQAYERLRRYYLVYLAGAAFLLAGLVPLTAGYLEQRLTRTELIVLPILQAMFAWSAVFGFLGAALTWFSAKRDWIRYVQESSLWIYVAHIPVVFFWQLTVWSLPWPAWGKLCFVTFASVTVTLVSFEFLVRYSLLGALLHGARKEHPVARGWRLEAVWLSVVAAVLLTAGGTFATRWDDFYGLCLHDVRAGEFYRCNKLGVENLEKVVADLGARSVISLSPSPVNAAWCEQHGVAEAEFELDEHEVPCAQELEQLVVALEQMPRPVLIAGGHRSPTLSGFGAAVAILADGGTLGEAAEQLGGRYSQLDGFEHCIVARPLRDYRDWLAGRASSPALFRQWIGEEHLTREEMTAAREREPEWQAMTGAPRYPRRF